MSARYLVLVPIAAAMVIALFVAVSPGAAHASIAAPVPREPDRVSSVVAGIARPLGGAVAIGDAMATVAIERVDGAPGDRLLRISVRDAAGQPMPSGAVTVRGHMRFMDHGSFSAVALPSGDGAYVALLRFAMAGDWELLVATPAGDLQLQLDDLR